MHRRPAALFLALLPLLALAPVAGADDAPTHTVPEVRPVQLDGKAAKAEWADGLPLTIEEGTTVRLQQYRGTLLLALASKRTWPDGSVLTLFLCPDGPQAGGRGPGCLRIEYEPFRHDRPHLIAYRHGAAAAATRVDGEVTARQQIGDHGTHIEMALPLTLLGQTKAKRVPVRLCVQWARRGSQALYYPQGLDFRGTAGEAPVDFVSAGRWALLDGFGDPSAPGAYPADQWKTWRDHDAEIARRGRTAHDVIALLTEEWKKTDKRDTEMLGEVVDNLAWIREHEPLTTDDVLAMATLWRYLGRHAQAATALTTMIDLSRQPHVRMRALHQRALVHHAAEQYERESADWSTLAELSGTAGGRYRLQAERAVTQGDAWATEQAARRAVEADPANPRVWIDTVRGPVVVVLHAKTAPEAVKHFLGLVDAKFYDGTLFHRVKGDFMAQGGDPKSRTMGCEFAGSGSSTVEIDMEVTPGHDFYRGALCFARPGHKEQNGSQFFIMTAPQPGMGKYTIFGHVLTGMAAVDRLELCDKLLRASRLTK